MVVSLAPVCVPHWQIGFTVVKVTLQSWMLLLLLHFRILVTVLLQWMVAAMMYA